MPSVLESVGWGKPALDLVKHSMELDPDSPAVMHLRHSERPQVSASAGLHLPLTDKGETAAYEFGLNLSVDREYYIYHTRIDRAKKTAENIHKGILDNKGVSKIIGVIPVGYVVDFEEYRSIIFRELEGKEEVVGTRNFFDLWLSGMYPPSVVKPSPEFAQQAASLMMRNLDEANPEDLHIWVSHDTWVAAFLRHWLKECSFNWVNFMDGFILQFHKDHMMSFYRGKKRKVKYPSKWNFFSPLKH